MKPVCALLLAFSVLLPPAGARVRRLTVSPARRARALEVRWQTSARRGQRFLFTLWRGRVLWLAATVSGSSARVALPGGFPGGRFLARIEPHQAADTNPPTAKLVLPGPAASTLQPLGYGTYTDRTGTPHRWFINRAATLIWDGSPYIPAGVMYLSKYLMDYGRDARRNEAAYKDDLERLGALRAAGVTDIYLNPCVEWRSRPTKAWQRFIDLCDQMGIRYGIQITRELDPLRFWDVASDRYTVPAQAGKAARLEISSDLLTTIDAESPVLYAAFNTATGAITDWGRAKVEAAVKGVTAEAIPKGPSGAALSVHFVPERTYDGGMHDYWKYVDDSFKNDLRGFIRELKLGPGMRLWIDPLDNEQSLQGYASRALPRSPRFQRAFEQYLRRLYPKPGMLAAAWGTSVRDHSAASRLVPLGAASPTSGAFAVDEQTGRLYEIHPERSRMWKDVVTFRETSVAAFNSEIAEAIKACADVPVVLKHEGTEMFTNARQYGGFDGLGAEAYGRDIEHLRDCSRSVHAQSKRCGRTMWELTTETGLVWSAPGYPDPERMLRDLTSMIEAGGKGTYCFLDMYTSTDPNSDWFIFNLAGDPRQLYWLGAYARLIKRSPMLPDYTPERLGGRDFQRDVLRLEHLDLGDAFQAARCGQSTYIWNMSGADCRLSLELVGGARNAAVTFADGTRRTFSGPMSVPLALAAHAAKPVIIDSPEKPRIGGVDRANLAAAMREWAAAREKAVAMGMPVGSQPGSTTWRDLLAEARDLAARTGDTFATRMRQVNVGGDLSEWRTVSPIYVKLNNDVAASRYERARFWVGCDGRCLYVAGQVDDDVVANNNRLGKLWNGDCVEVFIDLRPEASPGSAAYNADCFQFLFSPTGADGRPGMCVINPSLPPDSAPEKTLLAARETASGWQFEAAIAKEDLKGIELRPGAVLGFNIQLDNSDGGDRVWSKLWHGGEDCFRNRLAFGRLALGYD